MRRLIAVWLMITGLTACSGEGEDIDHVWQEQTDALKQAEEVNQVIMDKAERDREAIEQQSQ